MTQTGTYTEGCVRTNYFFPTYATLQFRRAGRRNWGISLCRLTQRAKLAVGDDSGGIYHLQRTAQAEHNILAGTN